VPVMNLRWGRKGYLASVIFRTFEHVHGITDLPKPIRHPAAGVVGNPALASGTLKRLHFLAQFERYL
jgi:hypothetical protein